MIIGYTMLHYGTDYLAYALRSIVQYVDKHVIVYSPSPTFGHATALPCPDSRDDLYAIAEGVLGKKLDWRENLPQNYGTVIDLYPQARLIIEVDADEVYPDALIVSLFRNFRHMRARYYRLPMIHHWRSFDYACHDAGWPVRMCIPGNSDGTAMSPDMPAHIHHFGYARMLSDMQYKIATSAHKGEWRAGWWEDVFLRFPERLTDLHPVVRDFWNAEPFPRECLPDVMRLHPWYGQEVIA